MMNWIFRSMIKYANKRAPQLQHLNLIDGHPIHLANRLRQRQESRETERSISNFAKIKGFSEEELQTHKQYYHDLMKVPEKERTRFDDLYDQYLGRLFNKNQKQQQ